MIQTIKFGESKKRIRFITKQKLCNMETAINNFENLVGELNPTSQTDYFPGPGDENDDNENENDDNNSEDKGNNTGDDNPPLDEEVVHSPLTTDPGGKPK